MQSGKYSNSMQKEITRTRTKVGSFHLGLKYRDCVAHFPHGYLQNVVPKGLFFTNLFPVPLPPARAENFSLSKKAL